MDARGQTVWDYLMLYGWIPVVIVLVVLAVLSLDIIPTPLQCSFIEQGNLFLEEYEITEEGIILVLRNATDQNFIEISLSTTALTADELNPTTLSAGDASSFSLVGGLKGDINKLVTITYRKFIPVITLPFGDDTTAEPPEDNNVMTQELVCLGTVS